MQKLDEVLAGVNTVAISGHVRPDGDCVGSCLATYNYIKAYYPKVSVDLYLEPIPNIFKFLQYSKEIMQTPQEDKVYDLFIVQDCGDAGRLGDFYPMYEKAKRTVCIDHHVSNASFADENYIFPEASSTSELIAELMDREKITKEIAECIYVGIVHDTGVFQYSCTSAKTMEIAGFLMERGIDYSKIVDETFYTKTFEQNQILGQALLKSQLFLDGKVIASVITNQEMEQFHVLPKHLDGIVNQLRVTKDVEIAVFLYQTGSNSFKVSTRCNSDFDLAELAVVFQGGGHKKAAGFTMEGTPDEILGKILAEIQKRL